MVEKVVASQKMLRLQVFERMAMLSNAVMEAVVHGLIVILPIQKGILSKIGKNMSICQYNFKFLGKLYRHHMKLILLQTIIIKKVQVISLVHGFH